MPSTPLADPIEWRPAPQKSLLLSGHIVILVSRVIEKWLDLLITPRHWN